MERVRGALSYHTADCGDTTSLHLPGRGLLCGLRHVRKVAQAQTQVGSRSTWSLQRLDALAEEVRAEFASAQGDARDTADDSRLSQYPVAALAAINRVLYVPPVGGYRETDCSPERHLSVKARKPSSSANHNSLASPLV
jgi:hypothetical protein